jgi:hypothetical protein
MPCPSLVKKKKKDLKLLGHVTLMELELSELEMGLSKSDEFFLFISPPGPLLSFNNFPNFTHFFAANSFNTSGSKRN